MRIIATIVRQSLLMLIKVYRYLWSPIYASHCRFYPSCSAYALEAINRHGVVNGLWLTIRRLLRCHPFAHGGLDPVPQWNGHAKMKFLKNFRATKITEQHHGR